jgi:hypothetical protein
MHWDPALLLVFAICTGTATGSLARHRGRSFLPWSIFGALAWFVAIPWLLFTKSQLNDRAAPRGAMLQSLLAFACAVAVFVADLVFAPAILPHCDYYTNISTLNKVVPVSPNGKSGEIANITNTREISRTESDIRCLGTARLKNSADVTIEYRFFIVNGKLLSEAQWK